MISNGKILICICHHFNEQRLIFLKKILNNFDSFNFEVKIIIDCNDVQIYNFLELKNNIEIKIHDNLKHPHSLASMHRENILNNIDNFEYFMYFEDDILLSEKNFLEYLKNFKILYPMGYVPSFIRLEEFGGELYVTDLIEKQINRPMLNIDGKRFVNTTNPYHAFWILPKKELKESIDKNLNNFICKGNTNRELMASYVIWCLNKTPYVMLDGDKFSEFSYSFHLPNNYSENPNSPFGKYKVESFKF